MSAGDSPASCNLPTGLGKTSVIRVWLLALASGARVPRRLVAEKLRSNLGELADALVVTAQYHDLGKKWKQFQTVLGNARWPRRVLAKSGKQDGRIAEKYRHEFGSLLDAVDDDAFCALKEEWKAFVLHVIATHHRCERPHFPADESYDPEPRGCDVAGVARGAAAVRAVPASAGSSA
jgi:CRISPR-associated helicase Cas3